MKTVLLTGATGQLGKALLRCLDKSWSLETPDRGTLNLLDQDCVHAYFKDHKFDLVIHAAAKVGGIQANVSDPAGFLQENLILNQNLISAAFHADVPELINIGSSCMYPRNHGILKEQDILAGPLEPTNEGYALAKITAAKYCQYLSAQYGVHYKTLIPCNLYGPDDNFDLETGHLVACAIQKIKLAKKNKHPSVEIWGSGKVRREFLYIDDLAQFVLHISNHLKELPAFLNTGFGKDYRVDEYYQHIAKIMAYEGVFTYNVSRPEGMTHKLMSSELAQKHGWAPKTNLHAGLRKVISAL